MATYPTVSFGKMVGGYSFCGMVSLSFALAQMDEGHSNPMLIREQIKHLYNDDGFKI